MTKREQEQYRWMMNALESVGIGFDDRQALRRISMQLHSWHERECGTNNGCIERDEASGIPQWRYADDKGKLYGYPIRDMEKGALKRLASIMARYPTLGHYVQTDPRGAALYILRPGDVPAGQKADSCYSRGICVY